MTNAEKYLKNESQRDDFLIEMILLLGGYMERRHTILC